MFCRRKFALYSDSIRPPPLFDKESLVKYSQQHRQHMSEPSTLGKKEKCCKCGISSGPHDLVPNDLHYAACTGNVQLVAKLMQNELSDRPDKSHRCCSKFQQDIHRCTALLSADITIVLSFCSVSHKERHTLLIPSREELRFTLFAGRDMQIVLSCFSVTEVTYIFVTTMGIRQ